jgi:hypothetical protein
MSKARIVGLLLSDEVKTSFITIVSMLVGSSIYPVIQQGSFQALLNLFVAISMGMMAVAIGQFVRFKLSNWQKRQEELYRAAVMPYARRKFDEMRVARKGR